MVNCRFDDREKTKRQKLLFGLRKGGRGRNGTTSRRTPFRFASLRPLPTSPASPLRGNLYPSGPSPCPCPGVDTPPGGCPLPPKKRFLYRIPPYFAVPRRISARPVEQKPTKTFSAPCSGTPGSAKTSQNVLSDVLPHLWQCKDYPLRIIILLCAWSLVRPDGGLGIGHGF